MVRREETCPAQQAKQKWLDKGEGNSQFFRALSSKNHRVVREMKIGEDRWLKSPKEIHFGAIEYFQNFLVVSPSLTVPDLSYMVNKVVSSSNNWQILELSSIQEIKAAVFSIPIDSILGPDGFS